MEISQNFVAFSEYVNKPLSLLHSGVKFDREPSLSQSKKLSDIKLSLSFRLKFINHSNWKV